MSSENERVVQTTLPDHEYQRFRRIAEEEGISLKEALRRAATAYADEQEGVDRDDPLFRTVDELDPVGDRTTAREMDDDLYGRDEE